MSTTSDMSAELSDDLAEAMLADAAAEVSSDELDALLQDVESDIEAAKSRRLWRVRDASTATRRTWLTAGLLLVVGAVALLTRRPDWAVYPGVRMAAEVVALLGGLAVTLAVGTRPLHRPRVNSVMRGALGVGALASWVLLALWAPAHADMAHQPAADASLWKTAVPCLLFGSALGLPALAALWLVDRHPSLNTTLAGVVGGLVAALGLQLHCPITSVGHRVVGHLLTSLLIVGVGVGVGVIARRRAALGRSGANPPA